MKRLFSVLITLVFTLTTFSQTKMIINKVNGTDSLWLTEIRSISFKTYSPNPAQTLLAWYPFNGSPNDSSGNGYNGTNHGAILTIDRFGNNNSAYYFTDGYTNSLAGSACIFIPELFPSAVSAFTFAAWVMKDTVDNNTHTILYKGLDQGEASLGITSTSTGVKLGFGVNLQNGSLGGQNWYSVSIPDTLKAKTYYFLVGRYTKGQKIDFSINGILSGSVVIPDTCLAQWPNHSYSAIGMHTQFPMTTGWSGVIDDIRIYDRALSDEEVQTLYHERGWAENQ
jgi:Concanavalin A-like lectin/glucanases superfamily